MVLGRRVGAGVLSSRVTLLDRSDGFTATDEFMIWFPGLAGIFPRKTLLGCSTIGLTGCACEVATWQ
ncbi:hypothetical protein PSCICJ_01550 [Pseudomonas cichorii]|nr:hypothetical protein PSCICJ_01550 [Pseudomonas cichorii]